MFTTWSHRHACVSIPSAPSLFVQITPSFGIVNSLNQIPIQSLSLPRHWVPFQALSHRDTAVVSNETGYRLLSLITNFDRLQHSLLLKLLCSPQRDTAYVLWWGASLLFPHKAASDPLPWFLMLQLGFTWTKCGSHLPDLKSQRPLR